MPHTTKMTWRPEQDARLIALVQSGASPNPVYFCPTADVECMAGRYTNVSIRRWREISELVGAARALVRGAEGSIDH